MVELITPPAPELVVPPGTGLTRFVSRPAQVQDRTVYNPRRIPALPQVWVWGIYGGKGQGKTAAAVYMAYRAWRDHKRRVLYWPSQLNLNFHQTLPWELREEWPPVEPISLLEIARLDDRLNDAFVILDEMHLLLPSTRASAMASSQIVGFLTQIRKRGSWLVWCTNSPRAVNQLVLDQTDIHGKAVGGKYIRKYNMMFLRLKDTQGAWSKGNDGWIGRRDVRRRMALRIREISGVFGLYDTNAIADPGETWELSKDLVLSQRATDNLEHELGIDHQTAFTLIQRAVVYAVEMEGAQVLSGAACAKIVSEQFIGGANFPAAYSGRLMAEAGLPVRRGNSNNFRVLPPKAYLEMWLNGQYVPPDPGTPEYTREYETAQG